MGLIIQILKIEQEKFKILGELLLAEIIKKNNYLNKNFKKIRQEIVKDNLIKIIYRY